MSRSSGKLNIIDESTYQCMTKDNGDATARALRSAKYKNKHKKDHQCTLFDFLIVPRKKDKNLNKQRRPNFNIKRNTVHFPTKRKGKTRLIPKLRVTRLKRIIKYHRQLKKQVVGNDPFCDIASNLQKLTIETSNKSNGGKVEPKVHTGLSAMENPSGSIPKLHSRRFRRWVERLFHHCLSFLYDIILLAIAITAQRHVSKN